MINVTKFLTKSAYMFDPNNPDDGEFREDCARAAGQLLEYIVADEDEEDWRILGPLGGRWS
jgi:NAD(P)H-flavin reductase